MYSIEELSEQVEKALTTIEFPQEPNNLYDPIKYVLLSGGKRIRPILTLSSCNMFKEILSDAIYPALAVEVFHNFTLVHDDIMDNADIRRGKETIHKKWSNSVAILSGDAMTIFAYKLLVKTDRKFILPIIDIFNSFSLGICEGQQFDMDFEKIKYISPEEYTKMIELKTAVLLKGALQIGAIIGEAKNSDVTLIGDFGLNLGLAFQLQDDLLDVYGDTNVFGKKLGGDIVSNKKTILVVKAFCNAKGEQLNKLNMLYQQNTIDAEAKIEEVVKIFNETNVKEETELLITNYYSKAIESIEKISISSNRKDVLLNIANKIMNRNS
ncbi:MAG: polyprenyl synthetase family protein [Bacteroidales bacterium]|nr:polyprenyl synthetase family protein [Bacteroidales bacterium]